MAISGREMLKLYLRAGWKFVSQRGSHVKVRKGNKTQIIPMHKELKKGMEHGLRKGLK